MVASTPAKTPLWPIATDYSKTVPTCWTLVANLPARVPWNYRWKTSWRVCCPSFAMPSPWVSVDTYKPAVMQATLDLGADIINDIWALRWRADGDGPTGQQVVSTHPNCGVCLMHMHRNPQTMQVAPMEGDVVPQVLLFLERIAQELRGLGVDSARICIDPGIGFGKTVQQNFALLAKQSSLLSLGYPVLAGWSRKSSLAAVTLRSLSNVATMDARDRLVPSVTAALLAVQNGARVVRVHDVKETVQALKVFETMQQCG